MMLPDQIAIAVFGCRNAGRAAPCLPRAGAGVLRWTPNVARGKERRRACGAGTMAERTDIPGGDDFDGNRWNDLHCTNAVKWAVRTTVEHETKRHGRTGSDAA